MSPESPEVRAGQAHMSQGKKKPLGPQGLAGAPAAHHPPAEMDRSDGGKCYSENENGRCQSGRTAALISVHRKLLSGGDTESKPQVTRRRQPHKKQEERHSKKRK